MMNINLYTLTAVKAIAESAGDTEVQDAIRVHLNSDEFGDGDCILYGYSMDEFTCDEDITDALTNNSPETYFTIDENGIYHA